MFRKIHPTLPIFIKPQANYQVVYTPGHLVVINNAQANALEVGWNSKDWADPSFKETFAIPLENLAREAAESWQDWKQADFNPEALIFSPGTDCNASCVYCYSRGYDPHQSISHFDPRFLKAAARLVAANCSAKGLPFNFAVHGEGEATLYWDSLIQAAAMTREVAREYDLVWTGYVGTNGLLSEEKLVWLGDNFNVVGISCDGPPEIQDYQRPGNKGQKTSSVIERNIRCLISRGHSPRIRTTITPGSMHRQAEIVAYLAGELGIRDIHFEPVYRAGKNQQIGFASVDAEAFAGYYLAAEREAAKRGCSLRLSGVRPDEIHGPYCHFLNQTLHICAPDRVIGCFFPGNGYDISKALTADNPFGLSLNNALPGRLRESATRIPERCQDCINIYHCSRDCPEFCYLEPTPAESEALPGFRCRLLKLLGETWISSAAALLAAESPELTESVLTNSSAADIPLITELLEHLPAGIDGDTILQQWEAAQPYFKPGPRQLPSPIWVLNGFSDDGSSARLKLCEQLKDKQAAQRALAVYIHIPFCDRKCGFCDCYSFPLNARNRHLEDLYIKNLVEEIIAWGRLDALKQKPVSTVHFGGGTPLLLSPDSFNRLIQVCRNNLCVSPDTEWALESTSSSIDSRTLTFLLQSNIRRLHLGVQTLEDTVRNEIGRREGAAATLEKLEAALNMDFVVSVDLVFGLPGESIGGFINTLLKLIDIGIDGFSLYQLQTSKRNQGWLQRSLQPTRNYTREYFIFQAAEQLLLLNGYQKNHFNHYSRQRDRNLYYTYPQRGEDLLGLGCTANGCLGNYHYRNHDFKRFMADGPGNSTVMGGIEDTSRNELRSIGTALASGRLWPSVFTDPRLQSLLVGWEEALWLARDPESDSYYLTSNGSWFINNMYEAIQLLA